MQSLASVDKPKPIIDYRLSFSVAVDASGGIG